MLSFIRDLIGRSPWLWDRIGFWLFVDNWHKQRYVSRLMCALGRHDYEFNCLVDDDEEWAELQCFYCCKIRHSHRTDRR